MFRKLNEKEVVEFKQWARENYSIGAEINTAFHPVVQNECELMNTEFKNKQDESKS